MKSRKIFLLTICLAALVITVAASLFPSRTSAETECQKIQRINAPIVAEFKARYADSSPAVVLAAIQESDSTALARQKYLSLTPEKRRAVWQAKFDNLSRYDESGVDRFTDPQWEFVETVRSEIGSLKFDGTDDPGHRKARTTQAKAIFADRPNLGRFLFGSLNATAALMNARAPLAPNCNCTLGVDFCWPGKTCGLKVPACITGWGCGWLWMDICDGECLDDK